MKSEDYLATRWNLTTGPVTVRRALCLGLLLTALAAGCRQDHDYAWGEYAIAPERVSLDAMPAGTAVTLVSGQTDSEPYELGSVGVHHYHGSLSQLTDAIISQLSDELEERDTAVREGAAKSLEVTVVDAKGTTGAWMLRVDMNVRATTGDGYVLNLPISNRTPATVPRGYNGAVALAVIGILNDSAIADYLKN